MKRNELRNMRFVGYGTLILLVGTFAIWGTTSKLSGAVIASGALEVASYRQVVQHQDGGRIEELRVTNGDVVTAGDILLSLDDSLLRPEYEIYNRLYIEALAEKGRLIAERDDLSAPVYPNILLELKEDTPEAIEIMASQNGLFDYRKEATAREIELLGERNAQAQQQIDGSLAELEALDTQLASLQNELVRNENLRKKGIVGAGVVSNIERQLSGFEGSKGKLEASIAAIKDEKSAIEIEVLKLRAKPKEEAITRLRELESREVEIYQRRSSIGEQLEKMTIRAPISGIVYGMNIFNSNTVISAGEPLLFIVPDGEPLVVRARISSADINDVSVGQIAELKFPAFNQRTTPFIGGNVKTVSADAFTDEQTGFRYYEVEVQPEEEIFDKLGSEKLTAGQPVDIFVHTGSRTFLDYLLRPLKDNFARAFREE